MPATSDNLMDEVGRVLREVSAEVIEPRFEALRDGDVRFKSPGEIVTVADEESERLITLRLAQLVPEAVMVGEERFSGGPGLADSLRNDLVWLVDPLDGTANFVAGSSEWAVMVALLRNGTTSAAWIWQPVAGNMYQAERGSGTTRNGRPVVRGRPSAAAADLRGSVLTRFLDEATRDRVEENRHRFAAITPGTSSAGIDYPLLVDGGQDFVMFWRTLPWDHAPGALLVEESGGRVRRLDGDEYAPRQTSSGLLAAANPAAWQEVRNALLGDLGADGGPNSRSPGQGPPES
jgi:fructose-1,6-bisphosphatase/inositol monophosphatase family enzyme